MWQCWGKAGDLEHEESFDSDAGPFPLVAHRLDIDPEEQEIQIA